MADISFEEVFAPAPQKTPVPSVPSSVKEGPISFESAMGLPEPKPGFFSSSTIWEGLKKTPGNVAALADMVWNIFPGMIGVGADIGARITALNEGRSQKEQGLAGQEIKTQVMEKLGSPFQKLMSALGYGENYDKSQVTRAMSWLTEQIEKGGEGVEKATGGKLTKEDVSSLADTLMNAAGAKGIDISLKPKPKPWEQPYKPGGKVTEEELRSREAKGYKTPEQEAAEAADARTAEFNAAGERVRAAEAAAAGKGKNAPPRPDAVVDLETALRIEEPAAQAARLKQARADAKAAFGKDNKAYDAYLKDQYDALARAKAEMDRLDKEGGYVYEVPPRGTPSGEPTWGDILRIMKKDASQRDAIENFQLRRYLGDSSKAAAILGAAYAAYEADPDEASKYGLTAAAILGVSPKGRIVKVGEDIARLPETKVRKGILDANKENLIDLLGASMYSSGMANTAVKELFQNSFDATKAAVYKKQIKQGNIDINVDSNARTVEMKDNGVGMTADIVQDAFFTIAGSDKSDLPPHLRSGGFGLAKMAFILGSEWIELTTVRDGVKTVVKASSDVIRRGTFDIVESNTTEPNGTTVKVKIPDKFKDPRTGEDRSIWMPYSAEEIPALSRPFLSDAKVTWNGNDLTPQIKEKMRDIPHFTKIKFGWGSGDIYFGIERKESPTQAILSSGIYQFDTYFSFPLKYERIPYDIVIDLRPDVGAKHADYPFNNSREAFKPQLKEDIAALQNYLARIARGAEAEDIKKSFAQFEVMDRTETHARAGKAGTRFNRLEGSTPESEAELRRMLDSLKNIKIANGKVTDSSGRILATSESERLRKQTFEAEKKLKDRDEMLTDMTGVDPKKPLFHNVTNVAWQKEFPESAVMFSKVGTILVDALEKAAEIPGFEGIRANPVYAGISIDKTSRGVKIKVPYEGFFVNPLATKSASVRGAAEGILHAMYHEIAHSQAMSHGDSFVVALADLTEGMGDVGHTDTLRARIRHAIEESPNLYTEMRRVYDRSTTKNIAQSLKGSDLPTGSRGSTGAASADVSGRGRSGGGEADAGAGRLPQEGRPGILGGRERGSADTRVLATIAATAGLSAIGAAVSGRDDAATGAIIGGTLGFATAAGLARSAAVRSVVNRGYTVLKQSLDGIPVIHNLEREMTNAIKSVQAYVAPEALGEKARQAAAVLGKRMSEEMRKQTVQFYKSAQTAAFWDANKGMQLPFLKAFEKGTVFPTAALNQMATRLRTWASNIEMQDKAMGLKYEPVDNYIYHIFEDPEGASNYLTAKYGNQWGNPGFTKGRSFDLIDDAMKHGYRLKTTNPEELMQMRQHATDIAQMKVDSLRDMAKWGLARRIKKAEDVKPGEYAWRSPNGEVYAMGSEANAIFTNAFKTRGLWEAQNVWGTGYRFLMQVKNLLVPIKLFSLFHAIHVQSMSAADALTSATRLLAADKMSLPRYGLELVEQAFLKDLLKSAREGHASAQIWRGKVDPATLTIFDRERLQRQADGGFVPDLAAEFRGNAIANWKKSVRSVMDSSNTVGGRIAGGAGSVFWFPWATLETVFTKPLFEIWIPALKTHAYDVATLRALEANPALKTNDLARQQAFREIQKSVDNRFGEMTYRTTFMNKLAKDVGVASLLSMGWQLGFLREYGGAVGQVAEAAAKKTGTGGLAGKVSRGELDKAIFVGFYTAQTMLLNGLMTYGFTGEMPTGMDYIYPRVGPKGADGKDDRVTTPYYSREFYAIGKHIQEHGLVSGVEYTIANKISPAISTLKAMWTGLDFFNKEIYDPDADLPTRTAQRLKFLFSEMEPVSSSSTTRAGKEDTKHVTLAWTGFSPAPTYVTDTATESAIKSTFGRYHKSITPFEKAQFGAEAKQLRAKAISGDDQGFAELLMSTSEKYGLTRQERENLGKRMRTDSSVNMFRALTDQQQLKLLREMPPEDRDKYLPKAKKKTRSAFLAEQ